jgi:hypothetical protein
MAKFRRATASKKRGNALIVFYRVATMARRFAAGTQLKSDRIVNTSKSRVDVAGISVNAKQPSPHLKPVQAGL